MLGGPSQEIPSKTGQQIIQTLISNSNNCSAQAREIIHNSMLFFEEKFNLSQSKK
jgi:hypothetical protein